MRTTFAKIFAISLECLLATGTVAVMTVLLCQFGELLRAEFHLRRAAEMAAQEATLPRATRDSVRAAIGRALEKSDLKSIADLPLITINGEPALRTSFESLRPADRVEVTLVAHASDIAPDVLACIGLSLGTQKVRGVAHWCKP